MYKMYTYGQVYNRPTQLESLVDKFIMPRMSQLSRVQAIGVLMARISQMRLPDGLESLSYPCEQYCNVGHLDVHHMLF